MDTSPDTLDFADIQLADVGRVGGKNASLGELFRALKPKGVGVLDGFATTADAYRRLLRVGGLEDRLRSIFASGPSAPRSGSASRLASVARRRPIIRSLRPGWWASARSAQRVAWLFKVSMGRERDKPPHLGQPAGMFVDRLSASHALHAGQIVGHPGKATPTRHAPTALRERMATVPSADSI
jgi:hypothetical protein